MHSDINQVDRMKALAGFKAASTKSSSPPTSPRAGIDISGVSHVINYRVPENAEDYVHRIGRTGRAEAEGDAFTILTADELDYAKSVEIFIDKRNPPPQVGGFRLHLHRPARRLPIQADPPQKKRWRRQKTPLNVFRPRAWPHADHGHA
jgi:superfamily II DNA/RNA helicase